ncbi:unnamed protein product, partial [Discosporangium mesarthrocarpum]
DKLAWIYCERELKPPEVVIFYPTDAIAEEAGNSTTWSVHIKGAVTLGVGDHPVARAIVAAAVQAARALDSDAELMERRLYNLLMDNERGKDVPVVLHACRGEVCFCLVQ